MWILSLLKPDPPPANRFPGGRIHHVPAGCALFEKGDTGDTMYVLINGSAEISSPGRSVERLGPGAIVGELSLVKPGPRRATVKARQDCEFLTLDAESFQDIVRQNPAFALDVMRSLARRIPAIPHA